MKKVFYTRVMLEGFQSYGDRTLFNLDRQGINLVKGENGRGKSTLFNAIYWAEYGVNLKKSVETYPENRPEGYKGTRVVVERTDGIYDYRIVRHLNYKGTTLGVKGGNTLMILRKSIEEPQFEAKHILGDGLHKSDMQDIIVQQLGVDAKIYLSSIFFGQRLKSLIDTSDADKRVIFEELFNLDFIDSAKEVARAKVNEETILLNSLIKEVEVAEDKIEDAKESISDGEKILKEFEDKKKLRVANAENVRKEIEDELMPIPDKITAMQEEYNSYDLSKINAAKVLLDEARTKDSEALNLHSDEKTKASKLERAYNTSVENVTKYTQELSEVATKCPYCEGDLKKDKVETVKKNIQEKIKAEKEVQKSTEKLIKDSTVLVESYKKKAEETSKEVLDAQDKYSKVSSGQTKAANLLSDIKVLESTKDRLEKQLEKQQQVVTEEKKAEKPKVDLQKHKDIIEKYEAVMTTGSKDIKDKEDYIAKASWWVKTGFGAGGLKSFVFNAMLAQLNLYAQKYAERLGFRVEFSVDMTKANKPFKTTIYDGEYERYFDDLSGGEKQRVDICIAFAMHDLVNKGNVDVNILIMDELFEGLDNRGVESAFDLIRQKAENKSVYLITHSDIIDSLNCKSINITKDNLGNTQIG